MKVIKILVFIGVWAGALAGSYYANPPIWYALPASLAWGWMWGDILFSRIGK